MTRIVLVTNVRLYAEGLALMLAAEGEFQVTATKHDLEECRETLKTQHPEVVLVDMATPESLAILRGLAHDQASPCLIALTVPDLEAEVMACMEAGASGFITRGAALGDLRETIKAALGGELRCSGRVAKTLLRRVQTLVAAQPDLALRNGLTRRELEIAALIERGLSNQEIADTLCLSLFTVKNHIHSLLTKLSVRRRGEAVSILRPLLARRSLTTSPPL